MMEDKIDELMSKQEEIDKEITLKKREVIQKERAKIDG